jgi:hypothetical protein
MICFPPYKGILDRVLHGILFFVGLPFFCDLIQTADVKRQRGNGHGETDFCFLVTAGLERVSADYKGDSRKRLFKELRISCRRRRAATDLQRGGGPATFFAMLRMFFLWKGVNNNHSTQP